jgi:site-specific DNA-methyltransferase (adenine-specific)
MIDLRLGDCIEVLKTLEDNSVDSVVCDPPYHLTATKGADKGFMGKEWDGGDIAFRTDVWRECLRVLKPGGHLLAFSSPRTYHRIAVAIEDAGFEIRDQIMWVYGSGFPKSHNIGKAIDKIEGKEVPTGKAFNVAGQGIGLNQNKELRSDHPNYIKPSYDNEYEGWGTALKPAHEPIVMARKPISEKSVAENVLKYGTGAINIDDCRIGTEPIQINKLNSDSNLHHNYTGEGGKWEGKTEISEGRFPANIMFDEEAGKLLDEQSGVKKGNEKKAKFVNYGNGEYGKKDGRKTQPTPKEIEGTWYGDKGGASRFFYCPKASKKEKNEGLNGLPEKQNIHRATHNGTGEASKGMDRFATQPKMNHHPTIKPLSLMEYLIKLITKPGGVVLDCFMGSGSTGVAAKRNGFSFIGVEKEEEYMEIAKQRIDYEKDI